MALIPVETDLDDPLASIEEPLPVHRDSTIEDIVEADLRFANGILHAMHAAWGKVTTIGQVCKLSAATFNAIKERRNILMQQYGAKSISFKSDFINPID